MNSFNHYAFGAVGEWMYEVLGGVRVDFSAPAVFTIAPRPGEGVDWAKTSFESVFGPVACEWATSDAGLTLDAVVPVGAPAEVWVPAAESAEITVAAEGAEFVRREDGAAVYRVGSGRYRFEVRN